MQTFLPYSNFIESARALDYRRLGKQRIEAKQIILSHLRVYSPLLSNKGRRGWQNHPASKIWN